MVITDLKVLRQVSLAVTHEDVKRLSLLERLREANSHAWVKGCGLSAIQIGIPLRFSWYKFGKHEGVLFNPVILKKYGSSIERESCLSIPDKSVLVERVVTIEYLNNKKKLVANGFMARLIQHEIDHMDGKLIIDYENKCEETLSSQSGEVLNIKAKN